MLRRCERCYKEYEFTRIGKKKIGGSYKHCKPCLAKIALERHRERRARGICVRCGEVSSGSFAMCNDCQNRQVIMARNRRRILKRAAIEYSGGKCVRCGFTSAYVKVFDFHHKDRKEKLTDVGTLVTGENWVRILEEISKCELICANCHRIEHNVLFVMRNYSDNRAVREALKELDVEEFIKSAA